MEAGRPSAPPPTEPPLVPIRPRVSGSDKTWHPGLLSKAPMHPSQSGSCSCRFTGQICTSTGPPCRSVAAILPSGQVNSVIADGVACVCCLEPRLSDQGTPSQELERGKATDSEGGVVASSMPCPRPGTYPRNFNSMVEKNQSNMAPCAAHSWKTPNEALCTGIGPGAAAHRHAALSPSPGDIFPFGVP